MRKIVVICLLIVNFIQVRAIDWFTGTVVLKSGIVLSGELSVNPLYNLVLYQDGDNVMVYPAHRVDRVLYYDEKENVNRKYLSVRQNRGAAILCRLYEVVVAGELTVLRKCRSTFSDPADDVGAYDYYVKEGKELVPIQKFRSRFYKRMVGSSRELVGFIESNSLSPNSSADAIKMLRFYNGIQSYRAVAFNDQVF